MYLWKIHITFIYWKNPYHIYVFTKNPYHIYLLKKNLYHIYLLKKIHIINIYWKKYSYHSYVKENYMISTYWTKNLISHQIHMHLSPKKSISHWFTEKSPYNICLPKNPYDIYLVFKKSHFTAIKKSISHLSFYIYLLKKNPYHLYLLKKIHTTSTYWKNSNHISILKKFISIDWKKIPCHIY